MKSNMEGVVLQKDLALFWSLFFYLSSMRPSWSIFSLQYLKGTACSCCMPDQYQVLVVKYQHTAIAQIPYRVNILLHFEGY